MLGRIKVGALISQDFALSHWPATRSGAAIDPNMEFECEWTGAFWECRADGYGMLHTGEYGNGSIFVHEREGVIMKSEIRDARLGAA